MYIGVRVMVEGISNDFEKDFSFETVWDILITSILEGRRRIYSRKSEDQARSLRIDEMAEISEPVNVSEEAVDIIVYDLYRKCPRTVIKQEKDIMHICVLDMVVSLGRDKGRKTGGREQRHSLGVMKNVIEAGGDLHSIINATYHDVTEERFDDIADRSSKASVAHNMQAAYDRGLEELTESVGKNDVLYAYKDELRGLIKRNLSNAVSQEREKVVESASKNLPKILNRLIRESEVRMGGILSSTDLFDDVEGKLAAKRWGKMQRLLTRSLTDAYDTSLMKMAFPRKGKKYALNSAVYTYDDVISHFFNMNSDENNEMASPLANKVQLELIKGNYDSYKDMDANQLDHHLRKNMGILSHDEYEKLKKLKEILDPEGVSLPESDEKNMQKFREFDPLLKNIKDEFKNKYLLEDLKRVLIVKLADALDNINNLNRRDLSLMIEEEPETPEDEKYFLRLVDLRKKTKFVMDRLEAFRWNPLHTPRDVTIPKRIYTLTKAFLVADAARMFTSFHGIDDEPKTQNDIALNDLLEKVTEKSTGVAYQCRADLVSRFLKEPKEELRRFNKSTIRDREQHLKSKKRLRAEPSYDSPAQYKKAIDSAFSKYTADLEEQKERRPRQVSDWQKKIIWYVKRGNLYELTEITEQGQLAGRVGALLNTVREKKKYDMERIITSHKYDAVKNYADSFFYISALAEAFHTIGGREDDNGKGYFIFGVYPTEENALKMQNVDIFNDRPTTKKSDPPVKISNIPPAKQDE